jgi:hypothetical protein
MNINAYDNDFDIIWYKMNLLKEYDSAIGLD